MPNKKKLSEMWAELSDKEKAMVRAAEANQKRDVYDDIGEKLGEKKREGEKGRRERGNLSGRTLQDYGSERAAKAAKSASKDAYYGSKKEERNKKARQAALQKMREGK